jgi:hypothetical protein
VPEERDVTEQALDALVYGPVGLAMYLRDTAPSFLKLFVARGRTVLDEQRKSVEGQLGQARSVGEFATTYGGPHVRRLVNDGLSRAWERAEEVLGTLGTLTGTVGGGVGRLTSWRTERRCSHGWFRLAGGPGHPRLRRAVRIPGR